MESNGVIVPLSGHKIAVHSSGSTLELSGGAHITKMDMAAANGVVHQVDSLIIVQSE
ncbi:Embryo cathepsin L-associated protein [Caligus rogercresseyi]|uniref:Embryo cathepsin L-associated protein n=1 Tax=Caligus rogercresseyi TaxID=217165 RepID=A0A7T8JVH9_CALRO|nr:Embryo cathepsin L-associated protein [Caligus rogercresseyi]